MFLAPEPEVPKEIKDGPAPDVETIERAYCEINQKQLVELVRMRARVDRLEYELKAYQRGREAGIKDGK